MRVHIQNQADPDAFDVNTAQWDDAVRRAAVRDMEISFGRTAGEFAAGLATADVLIAMPGTLLALLPLPLPANRLRVIFQLAAGIDRLTPFDWLPPDVAFWNNRGAHGAKAGEYAIMAILMLATGMPGFIAAQRERRWAAVHTPSVRGQRATIVGTGDLGAGAARQARRFGLVVTGVRPSGAAHPDFDDIVPTGRLDEVLPRTDFLVLACPLTVETRGLLDRSRLALLPAGAGLINVGRGALVDQEVLCDRLDAGALGGAVLDVTDPEPPPPDHRLWTTRNLLLTPHVSADDPVAYNALSLDIFFANLAAWRTGERPPNLVDFSRGY
jgi:glyoxylate/hydroxypyruvate reductase A